MASIAASATGDGVLWLSALRAEIAPVLALLERADPVRVGGRACWFAAPGSHRLWVALSGVGGASCQRTLTALLDEMPRVRVLSVGVAGALHPALQPGDVVVASRAASWPPGPVRSAPVFGATGGRFARGQVPGAFCTVPGSILSWHEPVLDSRLKARLHETYEADCVDMETGHAARVCEARSVPFLAVRGISDRAEGGGLDTEAWARAAWHATLVARQAVTASL